MNIYLRRLLHLGFLIALGGGGYYGWEKWHTTKAAEPVQLGTVERSDLTLKVTISGFVMPLRKAVITAPYAGYIKKVFVKVGDQVKAGAPIVSIAQTVSGQDEENFPLRSPLSGEVVQVWRTEGEAVGNALSGSSGGGGDQTIVRIDDKSKLLIDSNVPEIDIGKLTRNQEAVIRIMALPEKTYHGKIIKIALAAREGERWDRSKVEYPITVELLDADSALMPGMSAVMDVIVQEAQGVLTLAQEYVQKDSQGYFVTKANGQRQPIQIGMRNERAFEIKSGVALGDTVRPVDFLADTKGSL